MLLFVLKTQNKEDSMTNVKHPWPSYHKDYVINLKDDYVKVSEGEAAKFTIKLDRPYEGKEPLVVKYYTKDDTAEAKKGDYVAEAKYVVFTKGEQYEHIDVQTLDDKYKEPTEKFYVKLEEHSKYAKIDDGTGIVHIKDDTKHDYEKPTIKFWCEGGKGEEDIRVHFKIEGENKDGMVVKYHTEAGTANWFGKHTDDYKPSGGPGHNLYIKPHQKEGVVTIDVKDDHKKEYDEWFKVVLDKSHEYKNTGEIKCYITDDDHYHQPQPTATATGHDAMYA